MAKEQIRADMSDSMRHYRSALGRMARKFQRQGITEMRAGDGMVFTLASVTEEIERLDTHEHTFVATTTDRFCAVCGYKRPEEA